MGPTRSLTSFLRRGKQPKPLVISPKRNPTPKIPLEHDDLENDERVHSSPVSPASPYSTITVPTVFVIPPEEEQSETPPWCCFDASRNVAVDIDPMEMDWQTPLKLDPFAEDINGVQFRRLASLEGPDLAIVSGRGSKRHPHATVEDLEEEARRLSEDLRNLELSARTSVRPDTPSSTRSGTLRSRARSALLKISLRGTNPQETQPPAPLEDYTEYEPDRPIPKKQGLTRKHLSQIFSQTKTDRSPAAAAKRPFYRIRGVPSRSYYSEDGTAPHEVSGRGIPHFRESSEASGSLRSTNTTSPRPRFSMAELRRHFTAKDSVPSLDSTFSSPTTVTSSELDTPPLSRNYSTDEPSVSDTQPSIDQERLFEDELGHELFAPKSPPPQPFKFTLDALHFESLQFRSEDF